MKVTLVNYTQEAAEMLILAKSTRLKMSPSLLDDIRGWAPERKVEELRYIANSIPSSWEFVSYTFMVEQVSRAFTHQCVRTRHGSYAQQSLRVVSPGSGETFPFVMPAKIASSRHDDADESRWRQKLIAERIVREIEAGYVAMKNAGADAEDARSILPTNIATNILCKYNLRTLAELCHSRIGGRVQDEYREYVERCRATVLDVHPWAEPFLTPKNRDLAADIDAFAVAHLPAGETRRDLLKLADKVRAAK